MNKSKISILVLIVGLTALIGFFVGKALLGDSQLKPVQEDSAREIKTSYTEIDKEVFNSDAINPSVQITIQPNDKNPIGQ